MQPTKGKGEVTDASDNSINPSSTSSQPPIPPAQTTAITAHRAIRSRMAQSTLLVEAFRFRIGLYIVETDILLAYLHHTDGDLDNAEIRFLEAHEAAVAGWPAQNPGPQPPLPTLIGGRLYRYFQIAEQERRAAADMLPNLFNANRDVNNQVQFTISEAVLLLEQFTWDVARAATATNDELRSVHQRYDWASSDANDKYAFAFSLAVLLGITGRADWWSVSEHLRKSGNNLAAALRAWVLQGIKIKIHPKDNPGTKTHGKGRRTDRWGKPLPIPDYRGKPLYQPQVNTTWKKEADGTPEYHSSDDESSGFEPSRSRSHPKSAEDGFTSSDSESSIPRKKSAKVSKHNIAVATSRPRIESGVIVNFDEAAPEIHGYNEAKMLIEYIVPSSGSYRSNAFVHGRFHWPALNRGDNPKGKPVFDSDSQENIHFLGAWRRENYRRIMNHKMRPEGEQWPPVQEQFLYNLYKDEHEKRKAAGDDKLPMKIPEKLKDQWAELINKQFGTHRKGQALLQRANRIESTIKDFKLKRDMVYFKSLEKAANNFPEKERNRRDRLHTLIREGTALVGTATVNILNGSTPIGVQDLRSIGVGNDGTNQDGYLTDRAIAAGIATLRLRNTTVVDIQVANLYFADPTVQLPAIDAAAENVAVVMHFGDGVVAHWTVGVYNTRTRQYQLLDSLPDPEDDRRPIMIARMEAIVAHYFPAHGHPSQGPVSSFPQDNGQDCGIYVVENLRAIDQGRPVPRINGSEARIRLMREILNLIRSGQAVTGPAMGIASQGPSGSRT